MKRLFLSIVFFVCFCSVYSIKPFYKLAEINKPINVITSEITKCLLNSHFEVLGMYRPASRNNLRVIIFTCDELTSLATGVTDKGAFGSTLKIGLIGEGNTTIITMINPCYFSNAYFNNDINIDEVDFMTQRIDSLVNKALSPLSEKKEYYGNDIPKDELKSYHFLPYMAQFEDVVQLAEYDEYIDAVSFVKSNILKGVDHSELIYELNFDDKEISVFGISFQGKNILEQELVNLVGKDRVASLPLEILVQGNKVYMLNAKYRIPLYKSDISRFKLFKIISLSSEIKESMENIAKL